MHQLKSILHFMIKPFYLTAVLALSSFAFPASAEQKSFPEKDPVLTFDLPEKWTLRSESADGGSLRSASTALKVQAKVIHEAASMSLFKKLFDEDQGANANLTHRKITGKMNGPSEDGVQGFTGYHATAEVNFDGILDRDAAWALIRVNEKMSVWLTALLDEKSSQEDSAGMRKFLESVKPAKKSTVSAALPGQKLFPEKDPIISYELPEKWTAKVDDNGRLKIGPPDESIVINAAPYFGTLSMFNKMLPPRVEGVEEATEIEKPAEHTERGLTFRTAIYAAKIKGKPGRCFMMMFKGDEYHCLNMSMAAPDELSAENKADMGKFVKSISAPAK